MGAYHIGHNSKKVQFKQSLHFRKIFKKLSKLVVEYYVHHIYCTFFQFLATVCVAERFFLSQYVVAAPIYSESIKI